MVAQPDNSRKYIVAVGRTYRGTLYIISSEPLPTPRPVALLPARAESLSARCDCDGGIRWTPEGKAYPCFDCAAGDRMTVAMFDAEREAYADRLGEYTPCLQ